MPSRIYNQRRINEIGMNKEEKIKFANYELVAKGNLDIISEVFATNYVAHADGKDYKGHEFIKRWIKQIRSAIPDIQVAKVEFYIQTKDAIAWQRTLSGTFKANMKGIPPSNKKLKWTEMLVTRFEGEKIIEDWVVSELAGQLLLSLPAKE